MKIYIVTKNKHKVEEAKSVFSEYGINVEQISEDKDEPKNLGLQDVSEMNARKFHESTGKPIIVDDTGVFFLAYQNFPGNHPKLMFSSLGYKGLLKLVDGENRDAEFRTVVSYCDKNGIFSATGVLRCTIDTKVNDMNADVMPYERILLVDGKPISQFTRVEKNKISHRAKAFREIAKYLKT